MHNFTNSKNETKGNSMKRILARVSALAFAAATMPGSLMAQTPAMQFDGTYTGILSGNAKSCVSGEKKIKVESGHFRFSYRSSGQSYSDEITVKAEGYFAQDLSSGGIKGQIHDGHLSFTWSAPSCTFQYDGKKEV